MLSLETDGKQVWMATARSCQHDLGRLPTAARTSSPAPGRCTAATTRPVLRRRDARGGENAWIAMDGSDAYYNVSSTSPDSPCAGDAR